MIIWNEKQIEKQIENMKTWLLIKSKMKTLFDIIPIFLELQLYMCALCLLPYRFQLIVVPLCFGRQGKNEEDISKVVDC